MRWVGSGERRRLAGDERGAGADVDQPPPLLPSDTLSRRLLCRPTCTIGRLLLRGARVAESRAGRLQTSGGETCARLLMFAARGEAKATRMVVVAMGGQRGRRVWAGRGRRGE